MNGTMLSQIVKPLRLTKSRQKSSKKAKSPRRHVVRPEGPCVVTSFFKKPKTDRGFHDTTISISRMAMRILLLVRDPRATMHSRRSLAWCQKSEDCSDAHALCNDMISDHAALLRMQPKFPDQLR